jgi:outer membrane protein assembly factor BamB
MSLDSYSSNETVRSILFCIDAENGDEIWKYAMPESEISISTPSVANDTVYFPYVENYWAYGGIACVNASNGEVIWNQRLNNEFFIFSSPSIADEKLYIGAINSYAYGCVIDCYDIHSGAQIWSYIIDGIGQVTSSPAIADEKVFIASPSGKIFAFEDELKIGEIEGGIARVSAEIKNTGNNNLTDVDWSISLSGGIFDKINISINGNIETLEGHTIEMVKASPVIGLGDIEITVTASTADTNTLKKTINGFVFLFFVIIR